MNCKFHPPTPTQGMNRTHHVMTTSKTWHGWKRSNKRFDLLSQGDAPWRTRSDRPCQELHRRPHPIVPSMAASELKGTRCSHVPSWGYDTQKTHATGGLHEGAQIYGNANTHHKKMGYIIPAVSPALECECSEDCRFRKADAAPCYAPPLAGHRHLFRAIPEVVSYRGLDVTSK